jgi:hypothetical protein
MSVQYRSDYIHYVFAMSRYKLLNPIPKKIMAAPNYILQTQQHYTDSEAVHVIDSSDQIEGEETIAYSPAEISKSASIWAERSTRFSPEWR